MKVLPLSVGDAQSRPAFESFLRTCQDAARARRRPQLVSITLESEHLDPLAVLESIYDPGEMHFYCERPAEHLAVAGAEAVVSTVLDGASRFTAAKQFVAEALENTIAIGDLSLPFAGPHFFSAFGFFDDAEPDAPFPAATLFVPRWQVGCSDGRYSAVANLVVAADSAVDALAEKIWRANAKFHGFDYSAARTERFPHPMDVKTSEVGTPVGFHDAVASALQLIDAGTIEKIVLARALDAHASEAFHPLRMLNALRQRYPDCFSFSVGNGRGQSFIGASPERLVRIRERELLTEALAGSAPRGRTAGEDAALGGGLLRSEKDQREHKLVVESQRRRLQRLHLEPTVSDRPRLRQYSNVQHLHSPITASVPDALHVLDSVAELHPTPAVGGTPREQACADIARFEPFARGLYAGPIGWADHRGDGEFLVAIRSAFIDGDQGRLFAGAGIVAGSEPARESAEIDLKFRALLDALAER